MAEPGVTERRSIAGNAALSLAAQLTGAAFTAALTIFLTRRLGSGGYGVLSLAIGISGLVLLPSDFGMSYSIQRFVADHFDERRRVQALLADGLRLKLAAGLAVSGLLFGLAGPIAHWYDVPGLAWPVRGIAIAIFGQSMMMTNGVFGAVGRIELQLATAFTESAVQLTATIGLVLAGAGATGAAFGQAIGYAAGALLTIVLLVRLLGRRILPLSIRFGDEARRIGAYAGVLLIVDGAFTVFNQIDVLVIGAYEPARSVGYFSAPIQIITFLGYPGAALAAGVAPRLSRVATGGPNVGAFVKSLRLMLIVQAAIAGGILGEAGLIVHVGLGDQYGPSIGVLRGLAPFIWLSGFGALVSVSANFLGEASKRVPVALLTVAVNIALDLVLVPRMGVTGAVIGTDAAYAIYVPAHLEICRRALSLDLAPVALSLIRTATAGAMMAAIMFLFGDSVSRLPATIGGVASGTAVFVLVLVLTDEVSPRELIRAARALRRGPSATGPARGRAGRRR